MTLVVETGSGVRGANAYVNIAYVTAYLTSRNRQTENSWNSVSDSVKEAGIIAATDYIDKKFGPRFKGQPSFYLEETFAKASLVFTGQPGVGQTLNLGNDIYKFVSILTGDMYEVLVGSSFSITQLNLQDAINGALGDGVTYGSETPQSRHASALSAGNTLGLTAAAPGTGGALTVLLGPLNNVAINGFTGGLDGGLQPLAWPRSYSYDSFGELITGIPEKLKQAVSEYAVRAIASPLMSDMTIDSYGKVSSRRVEVGPIKEEFSYISGSITQHPSADRLLSSLLLNSGQGRVIRG